MQAETIASSDGTKIAARVFEPTSEQLGSVVIGGAMGVRRLGHFGPFRREQEQQLWPRIAKWLAGLHTLRTA